MNPVIKACLMVALSMAGVFATGETYADNKEPPLTAFGAMECKEWLKNARNSIPQVWVTGYITGLNRALGKRYGDPLAQVSSMDQVFRGVKEWCQSNPGASLESTVYLYYLYLSTKSKKGLD